MTATSRPAAASAWPSARPTSPPPTTTASILEAMSTVLTLAASAAREKGDGGIQLRHAQRVAGQVVGVIDGGERAEAGPELHLVRRRPRRKAEHVEGFGARADVLGQRLE